MNSIKRRSCITIAAIFITGFVVVNATAQAEDWKVDSSTKNASGSVTVVSFAGDGRKKTETIVYFSSGEIKNSDEEITDPSGKKMRRIYSDWESPGFQITHGVMEYDAAQKIRAGTRWSYRQVNGNFVGPKIVEKFDPGTGKWIPVTAPANQAAKPAPAPKPSPAAAPPKADMPSGNSGASGPAPNTPGPASESGRDQIISAMERTVTRLKRMAAEAAADPRKRPLVEKEIRTFLDYVDVQMAKEDVPERSARLADVYNSTDELLRSFNDTPNAEPDPAPPPTEPTVSDTPLAKIWSAPMKTGETSKVCPANPKRELGAAQSVGYIGGKYFILSPVCLAAVHNKLIDFAKGGTVKWRIVDIFLPADVLQSPPTDQSRNGVQAYEIRSTGASTGFAFLP